MPEALLIQRILQAQKNEITEYHIYRKIADSLRDSKNKKILYEISNDELMHYNFWKKHSKKDVSPNKLKIFYYYFISKILGITFALKLMEKGEDHANKNYQMLSKEIPGSLKVSKDEQKHENQLLSMIDEEKLKYIGSIVLGLNDALVELTGTLAGLTFALKDARLVAIAGAITGAAASLSMASSEYLSSKSDGAKNPFRAAFYTGIAYVFAVLLLVFPFILLENAYFALAFTVIDALLIIFFFTFYTSIAKDLPFKKRFFEMAAISMGVAVISFVIGILLRIALGVDV